MMSAPQQHRIKRKPVPPPQNGNASSGVSKSYIEVAQEECEPRTDCTITMPLPKELSWRPFWYRRRILLVFSLYLALLFAALQVVHSWSGKHDGFAIAGDNYYYLWTYGPTALLTLSLAIWNRIDYRVRQMAPWVHLNAPRGGSPTTTIFLDYLSPTKPEILWHSARNGDWLVTMSTTVGLLHTLLIVLSTALLTSIPVLTTMQDVRFQTTTKFKTSNSASVIPGAQSAYIYDAVGSLNLSYPFGVTPELTYSTFVTDDTRTSLRSAVQVPVDVLTFDLQCEDARLELDYWASQWSFGCDNASTVISSQVIYLTTDECKLRYSSDSPGLVEYANVGDVSNFAVLSRDVCNSSSPDAYTEPRDYRLALAYGMVVQKSTVGSRPVMQPNGTCSNSMNVGQLAYYNITRSRQWVCKPIIAVRDGVLSANLSELNTGQLPSVTVRDNSPKQIFMANSSWGITAPATDALLETHALPDGMLSPRTTVDGLVRRVLYYADGATQENLSTTESYLESTTRLYKALFAQEARLAWTISDNNQVFGSTSTYLERLVTRQVTVRLIEAVLAISMLLTVLSTMKIPKSPILPHDAAPLSGMCMIVASSTEYKRLLHGTGALDMSAISRKIRSGIFKTGFDMDDATPQHRAYKLKYEDVSNEKEGEEVGDEETRIGSEPGRGYWWPITVKGITQGLVALLIITVIITFEVLLSFSRKNQGLANVSTDRNRYLSWSLVPAITMVAISLYAGAVDTIYRTFAPYTRLRRGASLDQTIATNYLSPTQVEVLGLALRHRQFGVSMMTLASIMSSFLTIILSGVFSASQVPSVRSVSLSQMSHFNDSGTNDGDSAILSGLIFTANLSYPQWTYKDLVLTSIQLSEEDSQMISDTQKWTLQTVVPAIRSSLNCTAYEQSEIPDLIWYNGQVDSSWEDPMYLGVYANTPGPSHCARNSTSLVSLNDNSDNEIPFSFHGYTNDTRAGCPSLSFFWGSQTTNGTLIQLKTQWDQNSSTVDYASALTCNEIIEIVDVDVTFTMPGYKISGEPTVVEDSARKLSDVPMGMPNQDVFLEWQSFFDLLQYRYGLTFEDYASPNKTAAIAEMIKEGYGVVRAQQFNAALRVATDSADSTTTAQPLAGTLRNDDQYRLIQHPVSTHILCGILGSILTLGALAFILTDIRNVLPKNPSSIAAMTSLLADSNFVQDGTQDLVNEKHTKVRWWKRRKHPSGAIFKMGWFSRGPDNAQVFTIDKVSPGLHTDRQTSTVMVAGDTDAYNAHNRYRPASTLRKTSSPTVQEVADADHPLLDGSSNQVEHHMTPAIPARPPPSVGHMTENSVIHSVGHEAQHLSSTRYDMPVSPIDYADGGEEEDEDGSARHTRARQSHPSETEWLWRQRYNQTQARR